GRRALNNPPSGGAHSRSLRDALPIPQAGVVYGTPEYLSPEQARGKDIDFRADLYAMGIILYEMMTGVVPFTGDTALAILSGHVRSEEHTSELQSRFDIVCRLLLEKTE